uniref:Mitochondrial rRNA methyltransferase 1 n=1 Tax=Equus caballus TaxID=9796 RepID=A0A9L0SPT2_HORSE
MTWRRPCGPRRDWSFCLACPLVSWLCRTSQFFGLDGSSWTPCATTRSTRASAWSCPLTPVVSKASAGAVEVMDVFSTDDLAGFLQVKARQGWLVAGTVGCPGPETSLSSEMPITSCLEFVWDQPTLLVLGNEGSGLSQEVQASCQVLLTILPGRQLPPGLESLNVSVATGILLHSICSQRKAFPAEQKRGKLLQDPQEPPATSEGPRVAQQPGLSSGSEKERHVGG